ncbi:MAG: hypothetical protein QM737_15660 [Ferruginibacter sp.]
MSKIKKNQEATNIQKSKNKNDLSTIKEKQDHLKADKHGNNLFEKIGNKQFHPLPFHLEP